MTNIMKNFLLPFITVATLIATPAFADECKVATKEFVQAETLAAQKNHPEANIQSRMLTEAETKKLLDSKGPPPNAEGTDGLEFELVYNDNIAAINVYQNGCFINKLGPSLKQTIFNFLGLVDA